jgi:hypothetical protein
MNSQHHREGQIIKLRNLNTLTTLNTVHGTIQPIAQQENQDPICEIFAQSYRHQQAIRNAAKAHYRPHGYL